MPETAGSIETIKGDIGTDGAAIVKRWKQEIKLYDSEFEDWQKRGDKIIERYRDEKNRQSRRFNILLSNTETLKPAVYSKTPVPDVRRRILDPRNPDPAAREASIMLERALSHSISEYDFDGAIEAVRDDYLLPGRGVARVKYVPTHAPSMMPVDRIEDRYDGFGAVAGRQYVVGEQTYPEDRVEGLDRLPEGTMTPFSLEDMPRRQRPYVRRMADEEEVVYEQAVCEYVYWKDFGFTPARKWRDVRAVWFRHRLTRKQLVEAYGREIGGKVTLDWAPTMKGRNEEISDFFKRATVYEIWDKESRQEITIATGYDEGPLKVRDDPLRLEGFFPCPEPLDFYRTNDSLVPLSAFRAYQDQAHELDEINNRISVLINHLKVRGVYDAANEAIAEILKRDDGALVPVENWAELVEKGGLDRAISLMPLEDIVGALASLYQHRESLKQTIYEITGISDILRGASDPKETAKAQSIKAQFGSLRHQTPQKAVQRFVRDLLRLKAEIMAEHFSQETLQQISGIELPEAGQREQARMVLRQAQAQQQQAPPEFAVLAKRPTWGEVMEVLQSDALRGFHIDIGTDSTIQPDQERAKRESTEMIAAVTGYLKEAGAVVQEAPELGRFLVELLRLGLRQFKPGRVVEESLDEFAAQLENAPKQPRSDPKAQADMAKAEADKAKAQADAGTAQAKLAHEAQENEKDRELKRELAEREIESNEALEREKLMAQYGPSILEAIEKAATAHKEGLAQQQEAGQVQINAQQQAMVQALQAITEQMTQVLGMVAQTNTATLEALQRLGGEKEVVFRGGKPVGIRPVEAPRMLQ